VIDVILLSLPRLTVSPANGFEVIASFERHDLCVRPKYDRNGLQKKPRITYPTN
jgi:hypothetical protein